MTEETTSTEKPALNTWQRLKGTVLSPTATFRDVAAHPQFAGGALAACGINLVLTLAIAPKIKAYTQYAIASNPHIPAEQAAVMQNAASMAAVITAVVMSVIGSVLLWLVYAAVLKLINLFSGGRTAFGKLFAVAVFAYIPMLIGGLLHTVLMLFTPVEKCAYVTTSLAVVLPPPENI